MSSTPNKRLLAAVVKEKRGRVNFKFGEVSFLLLPVVARTTSFSDARKQSDHIECDSF